MMEKIYFSSKTPTPNEFNDILARLKKSFGVYSDSQLAEVLGVKPQAISGAKKRRRIPNKWLDLAVSHNISVKYILEGKHSDGGEDRKSDLTQISFKDYEDRIKRIAHEIAQIAIGEAEEPPDPYSIVIVQDRIQRNFVEAAIIKATKSFNELKGSVEKSGNPNEQVEKINTIISNLN